MEKRVSLKKIKTPIYDGLRALAITLLSASKIVTGPWGWVIKPVIIWALDYIIKPLFVKMRLDKALKKFKKKSEKTIEDYENANSKDSARDTFRDLS